MVMGVLGMAMDAEVAAEGYISTYLGMYDLMGNWINWRWGWRGSPRAPIRTRFFSFSLVPCQVLVRVPGNYFIIFS